MGNIRQVFGHPIQDAKKSIQLEVTSTDCRNGLRKSNGACAIAVAARRLYNIKDIRMHLSRTYVLYLGDNYYTRYITSPRARTEMVAFDRGGEFSPGMYSFHAPNPAVKLGKQRGSKTNQKTKKGRKVKSNRTKRHYNFVSNVRMKFGELGESV